MHDGIGHMVHPPLADTPLWQTPPPGRHPPWQTPPSRHPLLADTPPDTPLADTPQQTPPPPWQTPPSRHPHPPLADTPLADTPQDPEILHFNCKYTFLRFFKYLHRLMSINVLLT